MKKLTVIILALMMVFALTACNLNIGDLLAAITTDPVTQQTDPDASQQPPAGTTGGDEELTFTDGVWPENRWTENIPKPSFTIGEIEYDRGQELVIHFPEVTYEAMEAYSGEIAKVYSDATIIKTGSIYKWRTNVHQGDSIIWTIGLETTKDGTGFMTIINTQ